MDVRGAIRCYILENLMFTRDDAALVDGDSLLDRGIVDSTGMLEVVSFLEEKFGIHIDDEEMIPENLGSVSRIVAFVSRKRSAE